MEDSSAGYGNEAVITSELLRQLAYNEKMAELGKISAGLVQELNVPLSVIISAAQMIVREEGVPDSALEMVARINSEAQHLSNLTKGLLNLSSLDETVDEVDLNLTVEFILDFLHLEAARRRVVILKQLDYTLPPIRLDGNMLKQILLNIIMNALRAIGNDGGKVLVETTTAGSSCVCFTVSDNATGGQPESIDGIFDRRFTNNKPGADTGFSLFVTKRVLENMGGNISAARRNGGGTSFKVTLPLQQQQNT